MKQGRDETRQEFLARVAAWYILQHCPDETIYYDGADCDGYCLADDLAAEFRFENENHAALED